MLSVLRMFQAGLFPVKGAVFFASSNARPNGTQMCRLDSEAPPLAPSMPCAPSVLPQLKCRQAENVYRCQRCSEGGQLARSLVEKLACGLCIVESINCTILHWIYSWNIVFIWINQVSIGNNIIALWTGANATGEPIFVEGNINNHKKGKAVNNLKRVASSTQLYHYLDNSY